jgi:hypothetical protein
MPAASAVRHPPGAPAMHAVNGDGASLCEMVSAEDLLRADDLTWGDVPRDMRCPNCQTLMMSHGMGHL